MEKIFDIAKDSEQKLKSYNWRGNIRELENTMHRAILMSIEDELEADAIHIQESAFSSSTSASAVSPSKAPDPAGVGSAAQSTGSTTKNTAQVESLIGRTIADVERDMILNTLDHCLGNRTHAANILGISIRTLRNKLAQYKDEGLDIPAASSGGM